MVAARMVTTERGGIGGARKSNTQICALTQPAAARGAFPAVSSGGKCNKFLHLG